MTTKKTKKTSAKVTAPKVIKPTKVAYELVSFGIKATIPTQMYGNIIPEIVIKTKTIEDAETILRPVIEKLYADYASEGPDGKKANFVNKASVTAVERIVPMPEVKKVSNPVLPHDHTPGMTAPAPGPIKPQPIAKENVDALAEELAPRSPAYIKAENAIKSAMTAEALAVIEDQIQKSVKLTPEEKPVLLTEVLKKRKEIA